MISISTVIILFFGLFLFLISALLLKSCFPLGVVFIASHLCHMPNCTAEISTILVVDLILFHKCGVISCKANILSCPCGWFYIILFLICFIFQLHSWDSVTPVWLIWIARTVSPNACLCETAAALSTWVKAGVWTSRYASPAPHLDQVRSQCLIFATLCLSFSLKRIFELSEFASLK